ncbi:MULTISPECIES: SRPBCC family protein [unclassified Streptomyces]|uniref:SRPBCC family protein n=1 Tax=unclassified Streptomyces TaxID=2593676 RepID=UPI0035D5DE4B
MAVRHQLIAREPSVLWAVLEDESRYTDWVVGTFGSGPGDGRWPEVGSSIKYTVRVGPKEFHGRTTVRRLDALRALELEAHGGPLGTARIAFDVRPWGDKTLVILDEHPLRLRKSSKKCPRTRGERLNERTSPDSSSSHRCPVAGGFEGSSQHCWSAD